MRWVLISGLAFPATVVMILGCASFAHAVEPRNPTTLCERYLSESQQKDCEKKIQRISPDWYLAATCENIFDEGYFWDCLELNTIASFNPNQVGECQNNSKDYQILECVKSVAKWAQSDGVDYQRAPAGFSRPKKTKKK